MREAVHWDADGTPSSPRFQDVYRARSRALQQACAVYLGGCHLPQSWQGHECFSVLETGFGLGLNFLATWAQWELDMQRCQQLHFVSVEAYPVQAADLLRSAQALHSHHAQETAHAAKVQALAHTLAGVWRPPSEGVQRLEFAQGRVVLTLAVGDVQGVLPSLQVMADAVYLDGFNPKVNPQMWSDATLALVAQRCVPGTRLATYTAASAVRRGLKDLGFSVRRMPGLPPKWHRTEAVYRSDAV